MAKSKKPRKPKTEYPVGSATSSHRAEEAAAGYGGVQSPSSKKADDTPSVRYAKEGEVQKVADKIFAERKDLPRKLAQ